MPFAIACSTNSDPVLPVAPNTTIFMFFDFIVMNYYLITLKTNEMFGIMLKNDTFLVLILF